MAEIDALEQILGKPSDFILTLDKVKYLRKWAILKGVDPIKVHIMKNKDLANMYCETSSQPTTVNMVDLTTEIFVKIMNAVHVPGFNVDVTREVTRDETAKFLQSDQMRAIYETAAQAVFDRLPPRQIQVTAPNWTGPIVNGLTHYATSICLQIVGLNHPLMMVGPAGSGKTTIGETIAKALDLPFYITNAINDTFELTGFVDALGKYHATAFRRAFENGGVWVADEIDAWSASALLAANSALANGYCNFPDQSEPVHRHPQFRVVATANTFGTGADRVYVGRNELDAASLDRFATVEIDYDLSLERHLCNGRQEWLDFVWQVRKIVTAKKIRHVVSTRAIAMGSSALNIGMTRGNVEDFYLFKGISATDRKKIVERMENA